MPRIEVGDRPREAETRGRWQIDECVEIKVRSKTSFQKRARARLGVRVRLGTVPQMHLARALAAGEYTDRTQRCEDADADHC